ncbi:WhiB family transcriptional regulator (plasmid) [Streptomyces graminifolii]|uniref:WhiB family transcriptional regulator n=1 Tax=Streptomyces graminifolii TaxID=1266771 RepID=UPI00405955C5
MTLRDDSRWSPQEGAGQRARLPLLQEAVQPEDWHHRSACRGIDSDLFFPIGEGTQAQLQTKEARSYCRRCPVKTECLQSALDNDDQVGIWGGLTEKQRRALKRRGARA